MRDIEWGAACYCCCPNQAADFVVRCIRVYTVISTAPEVLEGGPICTLPSERIGKSRGGIVRNCFREPVCSELDITECQKAVYYTSWTATETMIHIYSICCHASSRQNLLLASEEARI